MKVLRLNINFKLPDDFDGNLNEAIGEIIKYRESKGLKGMPDQIDEDRSTDPVSMWNDFLRDVDEGYCCSGLFALGETKEGGLWEASLEDEETPDVSS